MARDCAWSDVDLRALQPAAVVDVDALPLAELVEGDGAGLTVAVAGVLDPTERKLDLGADGGGVDVDDPRLQLVDRPETGAQVGGVERQAQTVAGAVRHLERLVEGVDGDHRGGGAEDLLLGDAHVRAHLGEARGTVEAAAGELAVARDLAAEEQPGALPESDLGVGVDPLELARVDHRADVDALDQAVAEAKPSRAVDEGVGEVGEPGAVHDQPRARGAALAAGAERPPEGAVAGEL